jgi:hypothetical protein
MNKYDKDEIVVMGYSISVATFTIIIALLISLT